MILLVCFVSLFASIVIIPIAAQDPSVYGLFAQQSVAPSTRDKSLVYSKCFQGMDLITCIPNLPSDDTELSYDLAYYTALASIEGSNFCLQCCGTNPSNVDVWDLTCPATLATVVNTLNLFGYELRLARRQTLQDTEIVTCPLKRSCCSYNETGGLIGCDRQHDNTKLMAVTITINVEQYNDKFVYWNGVSSCEIEATETNETIRFGVTYNFQEKIILNHQPLGPLKLANDPTKILVIILLIIFLVFISLYFCRRKHCPYCQKKLLISMNLCFYCQLVGAEMPDPVLLKALEEKTLHAQGKIPERFPGSSILVGFIRSVIKLVCCIRPYTVVKILPVVDDATVVQKVVDGVVTEFVATDEESKDPSSQTPMKEKLNKKSILKNNTELNSTSSTTKKGKPKKEKPRNPNILDYPEDIIYKAVRHPFPPDGDKKV